MTYLESKCPACGEARTYVSHQVGAGRTKLIIPMRTCDACGTMNCFGSGYSESDGQLQADTTYLVNLIERKRPLWQNLLDLLISHGATAPCADIGCGIGCFIEFLENIGPSIGYDLNPYVIQTGNEMFPQLKLKCLPFGDDDEKFGTIVSIDTFEHLPDPDPLMERVVRALNPGGLFYLYVPRILPGHVEQLNRETPEDQMSFSAFYSPFRDLDVHITHYSSAGMAALGTRFGLKVLKDYVGGEWPCNGVLFQKL